MITRFTATKEMAEAAIIALHRNASRMRDEDYNHIYEFLRACKGRLPRRETVVRTLERLAVRRAAAQKGPVADATH